MPAWVGIDNGVISRVRIAIETLRIIRICYHRISRYKPPEHRVIVPCAVVVEFSAVVPSLTSEPLVRVVTSRLLRNFAIRRVLKDIYNRTGLVCDDVTRADVVLMVVVDVLCALRYRPRALRLKP